MAAPTIQRWLLESIGIIVVYWLAAYAMVVAQSGMGAPNLLWLPAGIALSAALIRGPMALAAIFIATISFHFYSFFAEVSSSLQAWAATMVTAFGSTLQALATAWLLRRCIRNLQINSVPDALIFILCTAAGCTIAASVGTLALISQNKLGNDPFSLIWLTWWVGDFTGMLVVAPLVLLVRYWRQGRREWSLLSLPIIGLGCSFTLVTAFIVKHLDHDGRVSEFQSSGLAMGQALQRSLELSQRDLMASHTLFYNIDVSDKEFHFFAKTVLAQNSLIRSLSWIPRVNHPQRRQFEAQARQQSKDDYRIYDLKPDGSKVPAADSTEYLPVLLIEPEAKDQNVAGFNLLSDPARREALVLSRFSGEPRVTRLVHLIRGGTAIVVFWPVYRNEYLNGSAGRDNDNLRGYVGMALAIDRLAEETLRPFENRGAETWLLDVSTPSNVDVLYHHIDGEQAPSSFAKPQLAQLRRGVYQETTHSFAGREWLLISRPLVLDGNLKANGQFIGILAGGFCLTFVLAIYMIGRQRSEHALQESHQALEHKVAERTEELRSANERLRQIDHLKSMFVASMSHELRTPLTAIIGFTELMQRDISSPLTNTQQDHLNRVDDSAHHLLELITDVIDVSKIEAGYADVTAETFSLNQLIDEALATIQPQRTEKGLGLEVEASGVISLNSDRKRLLQCVLNLLSNAVKYSEHGTLQVRLKDQPERVVIEIEDQGIGISAKAMTQLFQPFERIDTPLRIKTPGTGLGLYLTRKIMTDLLHGDVTVTSKPSRGSTFTLWLPHTLPAPEAGEKQP